MGDSISIEEAREIEKHRRGERVGRFLANYKQVDVTSLRAMDPDHLLPEHADLLDEVRKLEAIEIGYKCAPTFAEFHRILAGTKAERDDDGTFWAVPDDLDVVLDSPEWTDWLLQRYARLINKLGNSIIDDQAPIRLF